LVLTFVATCISKERGMKFNYMLILQVILVILFFGSGANELFGWFHERDIMEGLLWWILGTRYVSDLIDDLTNDIDLSVH